MKLNFAPIYYNPSLLVPTLSPSPFFIPRYPINLRNSQRVSNTITLAINDLPISTRQLQQSPPRAAMLHVKARLVDVVCRHKFQAARHGVLHGLDFSGRVAVLAGRGGVVLVVHSAGVIRQRLR